MEIIKEYIPYLYYFLIAVILTVTVFLIVKLSKLAKTAKVTADKLNCLNVKVEKLNQSKEKIDYTVKNSLPLFVSLASGYALIKMVFTDYKKTDRDYRSITKSTVKAAIKKPGAAKAIANIPRSF